MKNPRKGRSLLALVLAAVMFLSAVPFPARAASSSEIKKEIRALKEEKAIMQKQIDEIRSQYEANENEMLDMVNQKNVIDQEIALLHSQVVNINAQISAYSLLIADLQVELETAQVELDALNEKHKERIQAMEEEGSVTYWEVIFQANSFIDMLDRLNMMEEIAASDQRRLQEIGAVAEEVNAAQEAMAEERDALEQTKLDLASTQEQLDEKRAEADKILQDLAAKGEEFEALLDESEAAQADLMAEIAKKEKELSKAQYEEKLAAQAAAGNAPPSNSSWVCPVPYYTLTSPFGMRVHPVLGYKRMHNGIDMACASGTPIYATRSGTVTVASYQAGGAGNYVSINHGDGFSSIYMHMTKYIVYVGQQVSAGQLIGYVGSTGISTGPHLHFGISYAGNYVNPLAYIR